MEALDLKLQEAAPEIAVLVKDRSNLIRERDRTERLLKEKAATQQQLDDFNGKIDVINQRILDGLQRHAVLSDDLVRWKKQVRETAEASLAEMQADLESVGFRVRTTVRTGYPWQVILEIEKAEKPSIIVLGSHGRSNLSDMLLGSVSDRVSRKSRSPVLIVKRDPVN